MQCLSNWCLHTVKCHSAILIKERLSHVKTWLNLKLTLQSEGSQAEKAAH